MRHVKSRNHALRSPAPTTVRPTTRRRVRNLRRVRLVVPSACSTQEWELFTEQVVGEWDGVCATFDVDGEPRELPEYYVPQAYRDWDVKLYDWQSQCSMDSNESIGLSCVTRRMMPTVGCEADAIAFTEEVPQDLISGNSNAFYCAQGLATQSPGSAMANENAFDCKAEHILTLETGKRIRMVHLLKKMGPERLWRVHGIEVHVEKKESDYHGRRELIGCGGGMEPFAKTADPLDLDDLRSVFVTDRAKSNGLKLTRTGTENVINETWGFGETVDEGMTVIGLPKNCWTAFSCSTVDGSVLLKIVAGVLKDDGSSMVVVSQTSTNGELNEAKLLNAQCER